MIRLTILYNLQTDSSEEEFLKWRLTDHQEANRSIPGIIGNDFARILEEWPPGMPSRYKFITTIDWPDKASFNKGFYDPHVQADLKESLVKIADPIFLISEVLINQKMEDM